MRINGCYKFRSYYSSRGYLSNVGTYAYNSRSSRHNIWKIVKGVDGTRNSITFKNRSNRYGLKVLRNGLARFYWNAYLTKSKSAFYVTKGLVGRGVSFMPTGHKGYFLRNKYARGRGKTLLKVSKYNGKSSFKKHATFYAIRSKC